MSLSTTDFSSLKSRFESEIEAAGSPDAIEALRKTWTSKDGIIKGLFKELRDVPADQKADVAQKLNDLKTFVEESLENRIANFHASALAAQLEKEFIDCSLPGSTPGYGSPHPITRVERMIAEILAPFGFETIAGPEVETEYFCFDSLNIPPHHPARDMQDTYYTETGHVLRTHTTSVQARILKEGRLPVKVASFGRVYRNETEDTMHQAMFHQFELIWVEEGLTLSHLMALINHIMKGIYGKRRKVKFVPKFYPYTEPSIGVLIDDSRGVTDSGWATIAGAGMVHPNVLREFGYDPAKVSGIAFGLGTSRLAAEMFGVPTLKTLYENDLRILKGL